MADIVPAAIERLDPRCGCGSRLSQQAREEDLARVREIYARLKVAAEVAPFFADLPARIAAAHLVVSRSGARRSRNSRRSAGRRSWCRCRMRSTRTSPPTPACWRRRAGRIRLRQDDFTPDRLAAEITALATAPQKLVAMAAAARSQGALDAAERLADLVMKVADARVDDVGRRDAALPSCAGKTKRTTRRPRYEAAARHRPDPLRRHRRHRHERHRRGADQSRLHGAGLGRRRQRQRQAPARQGRHGRDRSCRRQSRRRRGRRRLDRDQARQSRTGRGARASVCRSCAAPRCWPS